MKPLKIVLTTVAILVTTGVFAQRINRGDVCQHIPNLTAEQKQKIDQQSLAHQNTMDDLRNQFYAESDGVKASAIKKQMNAEMAKHYRKISGLLTTKQKIWYDQQCLATGRRSYYSGKSLGRGQGFGRGMYYRRGQGFRSGQGYGRGQGQGRGRGMGRFTYQSDSNP